MKSNLKQKGRRRVTRRRPATERVPKKRKVVSRSLDNALSALLQWSQRSQGLTADVRRSVKEFETSVMQLAGRKTIMALEGDRRILQELYVWRAEIVAHSEPSDMERREALIEEGCALVEALFDVLAQQFQITVMHEPGEEIFSRKRSGRTYTFEGRIQPGAAACRVVFPGLRQGKAVLSPCALMPKDQSE